MPKDTDALLSDAAHCPIRNVVHKVGNKWSLLVLLSLQDRTLRFMELKRLIGDITQRVLTQTLRQLERDGYVARRIYPTSPPTVEYWLTPRGKSLLKAMSGLVAWANANFEGVIEARKAYDLAAAQGSPPAKQPV